MPLVSTFGSLSARALGLGGYRASGAFSPSSLFSAGEQGVWYDPSDLTTMFEDSAGTTAVHTPGNGTADSPVGKILDKSGRGNHATQATSTARPTLSARYNLLTYSEQFDNAAWTKQNGSISADSVTAPDGTTTADKFTEDGSNGSHGAYATTTLSAITYLTSICVKAGTRRYFVLRVNFSSTEYTSGVFDADISVGAFTKTQNGGSVIGTFTSANLGNGWYRITVEYNRTNSVAGSDCAWSLSDSATPTIGSYGGVSYTGDGTSYGYVWGADCRPKGDGVGLPVYQKISDANTYDSTGFPYYLKFDGSDDYLTAGDVCDIGTADGFTASAGAIMRGANGTIFAKSIAAGAAGRYWLVRDSGLLTFGYGVNTTTNLLTTYSDSSTEASRVITSKLDRTVASNVLRVNGSQVGSTTASAITGTINTTYRLLIGAYNNSTDSGQQTYLNGRILGVIHRIAVSTSTEIANTETWLNTKTKAY